MSNHILYKLYSTGFFHIFGTSVLNKTLIFFSGFILVRILTKQEYGFFTYAWNIYSLIMLASGLGMDCSVLQLCSEKKNDRPFFQQVVSFGAFTGVLFNLILCVLLINLGFFLSGAFEASRHLFFLLSLLPIVQFIYSLFCSIFRSLIYNQEFAYLSLISTVIFFISGITLAYFYREEGVIIAYYLSSIGGIIYSYKRLNLQLKSFSIKLNIKDRKSMFNIGIINVFNNGISQLLYILDVFILGVFLTDETILASYKVACLIPFGLLFVPMALVTYIYPFFAKNRFNIKWCRDYYKKLLCYFSLFNGFVSLILFFFAEYLIRVCFGDNYSDIIPLFRILIINYFFSASFRILSGNILASLRKLKFNFYVTLFSGIINVFLDIIFIQEYGVFGAAITTVVVTIFSGILNSGYLVYLLKR